jgi:hypothetical protein
MKLRIRIALALALLAPGLAVISIQAALSAAPPLFSNGLVAYYPFNANAQDETGNGYDGGAVGVTFETDRLGRKLSAASFTNNQSSALFMLKNPVPQGDQPRTLAFWFKADYRSITDHLVDQKVMRYDPTPVVGPASLNLRFIKNQAPTPPDQRDALMVTIGEQPGRRDVEARGTFFDGRWHHCAVVTDSQFNIWIYVDGDVPYVFRDTEPNAPIALGEATLTFGNSLYVGALDDLRIYSRALSPGEVAELFAAEQPKEGPRLSIAVRTVRLTLELIPGRKYQLESSTDLNKWMPVGIPFVSVLEQTFQDFEVGAAPTYYRIQELP